MKIRLKLQCLIPSQFLWNNFMVIMMKYHMNGLMVFWLLSLETLPKLKIPIENGWFSMGLSMLFGLKTWILYLMITKSFVLTLVKLLQWVVQWILFSSRWIFKLPVQLQFRVVVWFTCNQNQWDGEYCLTVGWILYLNTLMFKSKCLFLEWLIGLLITC